MTRRSMPSSFHANLFALVGARWRLLNMRRLLVSRHLARSGGFSLSVPKHRRYLGCCKLMKDVPNDYLAPVSVESVLLVGCPYNGLRMNRNQGAPVYGPEPL